MGSIALIRQTFLNAEWYEEQKNQYLSYNAIITKTSNILI